MRRTGSFVALAALAAGASFPALAQGIADPGERAFQYCFSCHSVDPSETATLPGPNLFGIVGRPIASQKGFRYSDAIKGFAAKNTVWTAPLLEQWMQNPQALAPGSLMEKPPGPRNEADRKALISYLAKQH